MIVRSVNRLSGLADVGGPSRSRYEDDAPSAKQKVQQDRMKDCNKQAGDKKLAGDERKKFMSTCLKG